METLKPLPDVDGPKLEPFGHEMVADDVEFLEQVQDSSAHGKILKIKIGDKCYALKIFTCNMTDLPNDEEYEAGPTSTMSREEFDQHFTPFENECRAFGRLKELGREHLAVKAYGYVVIPFTEAFVQKLRLLESKYEQTEKIRRFHEDDTTPFMGIVKDWVDRVAHDPNITAEEDKAAYDEMWQVRHFPRMLRDLHELHEIGIVVRDLGIWQYLNGVLVDLSLAWTMPHPFGPGRGWKPRWTFQSCAAWDLHSFQVGVIDDWRREAANYRKTASVGELAKLKAVPKTCSVRAYENAKKERELRPRPDRQRPFLPLLNKDSFKPDMVQLPRHDPGEFKPETISQAGKKRKGGEGPDGRAKRRKGPRGKKSPKILG
ncbi:hypothetical protein CEP53_004757 [Fusarium sp. AF-6]|nr:hypothetical protein CEP53_004757 [Fusarium sp. AF-6]